MSKLVREFPVINNEGDEGPGIFGERCAIVYMRPDAPMSSYVALNKAPGNYNMPMDSIIEIETHPRYGSVVPIPVEVLAEDYDLLTKALRGVPGIVAVTPKPSEAGWPVRAIEYEQFASPVKLVRKRQAFS